MNQKSFSYDYKDILKMTGMSYGALLQHVRRGSLEPSKLQSVLVFLMQHGNDKFRMSVLSAIIQRTSTTPAKSAAKRK